MGRGVVKSRCRGGRERERGRDSGPLRMGVSQSLFLLMSPLIVMRAHRCGCGCEWVGGRAAGGVSVVENETKKKLSAVTPLSPELAQNQGLQREEKR